MHFCHKSAPLLLPELKIFTNVTEVVDLLDSIGHSWTTLVVIERKLFHLAHIYVFINFLSKLFDKDTAKALLEKDLIGTTKDGHTIFCQFDTHDRCLGGKIIPYNPETGHLIKDGSVPAAMWVHSRLKALHQLPEDWTLSQCLFGEHLLPLCPDLPVALVEAEKTAVICSAVFPEFLWLATGGKRQLGSKLDILKGRTVVAFPDVDGYEEWKSKLSTLGITVSDWLERTATEYERKRKIDLADRIIEERLYGCQRNFD